MTEAPVPQEVMEGVPAGSSRRVELRCPEPGDSEHGKLFAVIEVGSVPSFVQPDNLIELSCGRCKRRMADEGRAVSRVLHRYDFAGALAGTLVEEMPESPASPV